MSLDAAFTAELTAAVEQATKEPESTASPGESSTTPTTEPEETQVTSGGGDNPAAEATPEGSPSLDGSPESSADSPETTAQSPEPKSAGRSAISDEALARAVRAGLSLADAKAFPSEAALVGAVASIEAARRPVERPVEKPAEKPAEPDPLDGLKLDPEAYEPEVVKTFEVLISEIKRQRDLLNEYRGQQEQTAAAATRANAQEVERWFDAQVAGLGEEFHATLGTGGFAGLAPGSAQHRKRGAIAQKMSVLLAGYQASGQVPPREDVFREAAGIVLRDEYQAIHEKKLAGELESRAKQTIQRVGGRKSKPTQSPAEEAAELLREKFGV